MKIYTEHVSKSGTGRGKQGRNKRSNERSQLIMKYITFVQELNTTKHTENC
jgi:hypothetical protein